MKLIPCKGHVLDAVVHKDLLEKMASKKEGVLFDELIKLAFAPPAPAPGGDPMAAMAGDPMAAMGGAMPPMPMPMPGGDPMAAMGGAMPPMPGGDPMAAAMGGAPAPVEDPLAGAPIDAPVPGSTEEGDEFAGPEDELVTKTELKDAVTEAVQAAFEAQGSGAPAEEGKPAEGVADPRDEEIARLSESVARLEEASNTEGVADPVSPVENGMPDDSEPSTISTEVPGEESAADPAEGDSEVVQALRDSGLYTG